MARMRRFFKRRPTAAQTDAAKRLQAEARASEKLHEMAARLHVLEWEAYGQPKKRPER